MNNYINLLADLTNMEEVIKDKDKNLILLSFFTDEENETFVLTLINVSNHLVIMRYQLLM